MPHDETLSQVVNMTCLMVRPSRFEGCKHDVPHDDETDGCRDEETRRSSDLDLALISVEISSMLNAQKRRPLPT